MADDTSVRVAVRIRPQVAREVIDMCRICTQVPPGEPQVFLGPDKAFTYDYVFDTGIGQCTIYDTCVARLVEGALDGYNATVLAYGQTGSGKTYTMGTGFDVEVEESVVGIIPRAIKHLFDGIAEKQQHARDRAQMPPEFKVTAQFLELYNEDLKDLLEPGGPRGGARIHEDTSGNIHLAGVEPRVVTSLDQALDYLRLGALSRTTGSTQMNTQSSRSHAIFTLYIRQQRCIKVEDPDADIDTSGTEPANEFETLTAKFHFVDLAGSERLKRTGATGDRAKEGISINCGLLALGNVISALGDKTKKALHVPYRDSKLTRLLQDSLGGNSQTVMIACVSPSDRDFMETLSTLKYANRARNIKNKVTINQDKSSRTIASLRREIQQLQLELMEYRQGKRVVGEDGVNDAWHENQMLNSELQSLRTRVKALSETVEALTAKNVLLLAEKAAGQWVSSTGGNGDVTSLVQGYVQEIEELRARLLEAEAMYQQLKKRQMQVNAANPYGDSGYVFQSDSTSVLNDAKKDLQKEMETLTALKEQQSYSGNTANKEEGEGDDAEVGQESASEDDSDNDSDRKEEDEEEAAMGRELEALTSDIDMKQRLIQELELSQRRLQTMKQHYEDKLAQLQARIKDTQEERDKVLHSLQQQPTPPTEKVKKLRDEYEKKLTAMQKEVRLLQSAKKEHARLLKSQSQNENRLRGLRNELAEMKRAKVKLLNKMREEAQRHKENELRRNREIAQLRKETRKNANMIRTLEADKRMKEVVLRRKQEEVTALRKRDRGLSQKVAGRTPPKPVNPKALKQRWQTFERTIAKQALAKQAAAETEREMERLLQEREELGRELEKLQKHRNDITNRRGDSSDVDEEIDNVKSKISYLQDSISECQRDMMEVGDGETEGEPGVEALISTVQTVDEAQYLLQRMLAFTVEQSCVAAQKQLEVRDMESRLNQVAQESDVQHQLLEHVLRDRDLLSLTNSHHNNTMNYSPPSSRSSSPDNETYSHVIMGEERQRNNKVRRRTTQPQELLYGVQANPDNIKTEEQSQSHNHPLTRVPSAPGSLKGLVLTRSQHNIIGGSPTLSRRDSTSPRPLRRPLHPGGGSM
ncbi:kinesin-like protein 31E isoform X4 [Halictus rubicundus]